MDNELNVKSQLCNLFQQYFWSLFQKKKSEKTNLQHFLYFIFNNRFWVF